MEPIIVVMLLGGTAAAVAIIAAAKRHARVRPAGVGELATRLGWTYRDEVPFATLPDLDRFELFRPGRGKKLRNVMTSPGDGPRAVVFDYSYVTGGGNSQQTHRQTVFYTVRDDLNLPSFSLRPENFFHRVAGVFGYKDINFDQRPEFSRLFLLRGEDEPRIRDAFNGDVFEFFEQRPRTCAAGVGRELLFWKLGGLVPVDGIEGLIREGHDIAGRFVPVRREM
jgi:hypothetical protein